MHRENLCLAVGFACPQQFPPGVRSYALQQRSRGEVEAVFGLCLFGLYPTFIRVGLILKHACMSTDECVRESVGWSPRSDVLLHAARHRVEHDALQMMTDSQKPCS